jgi:hypothetical protein
MALIGAEFLTAFRAEQKTEIHPRTRRNAGALCGHQA